GLERGEVEAVLQVEGDDEEDAREPREVRATDPGTEREGPGAGERGRDDRVPAPPLEAPLPPHERPEGDGGDGDEPPGRSRQPAPLGGGDERQHEAERAHPEEREADDVEAQRTGGTRRAREELPRQRQEHEPDGDVDEEDRPPPLVLAEGREEEAADEPPRRGGDPDDGAEHPERPPALRAREELLDEADDLGVEDARGDALEDPHERERGRGRHEAAGRGREDEPRE